MPGQKNPMSDRVRWLFLACLVILSLLGMFALWRSTPYGLGLVNDSATYIEGATNLLAGKGYVRISGGGEIKPITHFPPLFSILLAGLGALGVDLLQGARLLVVFLFGLDIFLVGLCIFKISRSMLFAGLGALLLAVSDVHLGVYSFALSEPLFITLLLVAFLCLAESFDQPLSHWLILSGLCLSLAYLTRFAGASLFATALLVILLLKSPQPVKRIGLLLAGTILPLFAWLVYSLVQNGGAALGNRLLLWHPLPMSALFEALKNLLTWIAPDDLLNAVPLWGRLLSLFSVLLLPALAAWLVWLIWRRFKPAGQGHDLQGGIALAFTLGGHILVYLAFLVLTLTFFDASTPLDDRILSVIYIPEIILFSSALAWLWQRSSRVPVLGWSIVALCALLAALSIKDGYAAVQQLGREGQGFAHRGLKDSPAIQEIREMPPLIIYSNKPGAIFLLTGKTAYVTPTPLDPVTSQGRPGYSDDLATMQQRVKDGEAILVLFGLRDSPDPSEVDLFTQLTAGLNLQADYGEILIYGATP